MLISGNFKLLCLTADKHSAIIGGSYLKSMIKRVLSEGTSQRAGGGGMSAWRAVRNGFVRCVDELAVVYDAASRYRGRIY